MLFEEFPFLKVAYIDEQLDDITGEPAFYSCVIDKTSPLVKEATTGSAAPHYKKFDCLATRFLVTGKRTIRIMPLCSLAESYSNASTPIRTTTWRLRSVLEAC